MKRYKTRACPDCRQARFELGRADKNEFMSALAEQHLEDCTGKAIIYYKTPNVSTFILKEAE